MGIDYRLLKRISIVIVSMVILRMNCSSLHAREITDMAGRKVTVPSKIKTVCADWSPIMYLLYALDPTLLAGTSDRFSEEQLSYVPLQARNLPVVKGFFAPGDPANVEALLKAKPDAVIAEIPATPGMNSKGEEMLANLHLPIVYVKLDATTDYPEAFLFLGNLLDRQKRAQELAAYGRSALKEIARIVDSVPKEKRPRVYYAEGVSGLSTECHTSYHAELIDMVGATNVHRCAGGAFKVRGRVVVSLEQIMLYDPDVIIAEEPEFYKAVFSDKRWESIRAVKAGRVYLVPRLLFNWFDHPPSFMRLLSIKWLAWRLYGNSYPLDMVKEARAFYRLFLGVEIPDDIMKKKLQL